MSIGQDLTGRRFGKLTVVKKAPSDNGIVWECACDCGRTHFAKTGHLNAGGIKSCGCISWKHGHSGNTKTPRSREYVSYHNMIARCHKKSNKRYFDYGGKGITVCDRWRHSFENFLEDMGLCPDGFQIDRIDNRQGYCPKNCRWVSPKENIRNREMSRVWVLFGKMFQTAFDAAKVFGVSQNTVSAWCQGRIVKNKGKEIYYPPIPFCYTSKWQK